MIKSIRLTCFFAVAGLYATSPALAQTGPAAKLGVQVRVGAMYFSPLVEDAVRSRAVAASIPAQQSDGVSVHQGMAPALTVSVLYPLRRHLDLELSGTYANSLVRGNDDFAEWDMDEVSVANALVGFGWRYRSLLSLHGGVGITKLMGSETGMFAEGNGIRPLLEAGASLAVPFYPALRVDARVQTHSFSTATLRNEGSNAGNVLRAVAALSLTVGGQR